MADQEFDNPLRAYALELKEHLGKTPTLPTLLRFAVREAQDLDVLVSPNTPDPAANLLKAALLEMRAKNKQNGNGSNGSELLNQIVEFGLREHFWAVQKPLVDGTKPQDQDLLPLEVGHFSFDPLKRKLSKIDGSTDLLSPREAALFMVLARNPYHLVTPRMIGQAWQLEQVYQDTKSFQSLIWSQITSLRRRIGDQLLDPTLSPRYAKNDYRYINHVLTYGYIFDPEGEGKIRRAQPEIP